MKLVQSLKIFTAILLITMIFIGGLFIGNIYNITDLLCPAKAEPYVLDQDFMSKEGIIIPKGTIVAVRQCAYMQRFNYQFAIDNATKLKQYNGYTDTVYGFSELYPKGE